MTENQRRKFLKLVGASLAGAAGVSILGCTPEKTQDDSKELRNHTQEALAERLKELAESEPPTDLRQGALCYQSSLPGNTKIPCLACGRIMIVGEKGEILSAYHVPLKRIRDLGVDATLIIPRHCPICGFGLLKEKFLLAIRYPNDPDFVRVELDEAHDLELMALFLQGKDRWKDDRDGEYALKDKVDRLRELFGVKEP